MNASVSWFHGSDKRKYLEMKPSQEMSVNTVGYDNTFSLKKIKAEHPYVE